MRSINKLSILMIVLVSAVLVGSAGLNQGTYAEKDCTVGTHHGDNHPSEKKFKHQTDACELALCVDKSECSNNDRMSKSQQEKIINSADDDEQKCLKKAAKDGHGQDGLVGYEVLDCHY